MKATGIVRRIDDLGRIVIPKETRDVLDLHDGDPMEIFLDGEQIILQKHEPGCVFCGSVEYTREIHGKRACQSCVAEVAQYDHPLA